MTTDRELLGLAAKAIGVTVRWHASGHYGPTMEIMEDDAGGPPWNPLTDDGDALRLAVKLGASIISGTHKVVCEIVPQEEGPVAYKTETYGDDRFAATRRAIVRAAAEIAKGN